MTAPAGQTCANCSFFVNLECHAREPIPGELPNRKAARWAPVDADDWCAQWNCWPGRQNPDAKECLFGTADPSAGADGDFYVKYDVLLHSLLIYQKQSGNWLLVTTVL
jgi:hypothetical protein